MSLFGDVTLGAGATRGQGAAKHTLDHGGGDLNGRVSSSSGDILSLG